MSSAGEPQSQDASLSDAYGTAETRQRILDAAWALVVERGARLTLTDVARRAEVSRQALYLHFGDRAGLLVAVVQHMDATLDLADELAAIHAAPDGRALIEAVMWLNTRFWRQVFPVAQVLEAAQHTDDALGAAWRDRMRYRLANFRGIIETLAGLGGLAGEWTIDDATASLYALTHFDTWRELVIEMEWTDEHYVATMTRLAAPALLAE